MKHDSGSRASTQESNLVKSTYNPLTHTFMATKEVSLSHAERLELGKILSDTKYPSLSDMGHAIDDAKATAHTEEEIKKINLRAVNEGKSLAWDEDNELKACTLHEASVNAVLAAVKAKDENKDWGIGDQGVASLAEKLK